MFQCIMELRWQTVIDDQPLDQQHVLHCTELCLSTVAVNILHSDVEHIHCFSSVCYHVSSHLTVCTVWWGGLCSVCVSCATRAHTHTRGNICSHMSGGGRTHLLRMVLVSSCKAICTVAIWQGKTRKENKTSWQTQDWTKCSIRVKHWFFCVL